MVSIQPVALLLTAILWVPSAMADETSGTSDWPQWGGANRDFKVPAMELENWPAEGLEPRWQKPIGEGYSGIAAVGDRIYTQYREGDEEIVMALNPADGETVWAHRFDAAPRDGMKLGYGSGPHSTPTWFDGRLFTTGLNGTLHAFEADTGKVLWKKELWGEELGGSVLVRGYGSSPLIYGETVILPVGTARGLVAFGQADGNVVWESDTFENSQSSPILIEVSSGDGAKAQVVSLVNDEVIGVDPEDGTTLWRFPHKSGGPYNITTPVWDAETSRLFVSSAYGGGGKALSLAYDGDQATVEEAWSTNRLSIQFTNAVLVDGVLYGTHGRSSYLLTAIDMASGEALWRKRGFDRVSLVHAGDKSIAIAETGRLMLIGLRREYPSMFSEFQLSEERTWTVPTVAGNVLYIRDEESIWAFELPVRE